MNVTDYNEIWQIEVGGQIYEARLEEMAQWIFEGSVLRQDLVRRGNLRWIEAQKVPSLMTFFQAFDQGMPPPVFVSTIDAQGGSENHPAPSQNFPPGHSFDNGNFQNNVTAPLENNMRAAQNPFETARTEQNFKNQNPWEAPQFTPPAQEGYEPLAAELNLMPADFCSLHPDEPSAFWCATCGNGFCPACPKSYGGTVKICPFCGAMCKSVKEVRESSQAANRYDADMSKGFGAEDFFNALAYPFKFKSSLFFGAVMFMLFTLGQSAGSMGSIFLIGGALICWMLANMLTFGVLANTVENFAQGRIGGNFMPSFEDFSLWDDVVHPFFLSIGVYLVSFGLVIVIIAGTVLWGLNQVSNAITDSYQPGSSQFETDKNSPLNKTPSFEKQNELYADGEMPDEATINGSRTYPGDTEEDVRRANELINNYRKKQLESTVGKSPETVRAERELMIQSFMRSGLAILLLVGLGLLWGVFYFPAACCVAGYTRSFVATMNPAVGLETIKLLGWDYVKIWFMGLALVIISFFVGLFLGMILYAFDMPTFGNLPAKAIGALFSFYVSVVFSVILGFALYKNADKMNLFKG